jgi:hypothetical protein
LGSNTARLPHATELIDYSLTGLGKLRVFGKESLVGGFGGFRVNTKLAHNRAAVATIDER